MYSRKLRKIFSNTYLCLCIKNISVVSVYEQKYEETNDYRLILNIILKSLYGLLSKIYIFSVSFEQLYLTWNVGECSQTRPFRNMIYK